eukprot:TRINITY_DN5643_c0_g2_i6.p1 TRINITY_DN5643_c0_g2~~TRINITY_DN5643_c0_g2_i6.p1  ORF type:complete len:783 (+),score=110.52 TRINITY_DN5643_c0_g2_i6:53-2350(+)
MPGGSYSWHTGLRHDSPRSPAASAGSTPWRPPGRSNSGSQGSSYRVHASASPQRVQQPGYAQPHVPPLAPLSPAQSAPVGAQHVTPRRSRLPTSPVQPLRLAPGQHHSPESDWARAYPLSSPPQPTQGVPISPRLLAAAPAPPPRMPRGRSPTRAPPRRSAFRPLSPSRPPPPCSHEVQSTLNRLLSGGRRNEGIPVRLSAKGQARGSESLRGKQLGLLVRVGDDSRALCGEVLCPNGGRELFWLDEIEPTAEPDTRRLTSPARARAEAPQLEEVHAPMRPREPAAAAARSEPRRQHHEVAVIDVPAPPRHQQVGAVAAAPDAGPRGRSASRPPELRPPSSPVGQDPSPPASKPLIIGCAAKLNTAGELRWRQRGDTTTAKYLKPGEVGAVVRLSRQAGEDTVVVRNPRGCHHSYWITEIESAEEAIIPGSPVGSPSASAASPLSVEVESPRLSDAAPQSGAPSPRSRSGLYVGACCSLTDSGVKRFKRRTFRPKEYLRPGELGKVLRFGRQVAGDTTVLVRCPRGGEHLYWRTDVQPRDADADVEEPDQPARLPVVVGGYAELSPDGELRFSRRPPNDACLQPGEVGVVTRLGEQQDRQTALVRTREGHSHLYWQDEVQGVEVLDEAGEPASPFQYRDVALSPAHSLGSPRSPGPFLRSAGCSPMGESCGATPACILSPRMEAEDASVQSPLSGVLSVGKSVRLSEDYARGKDWSDGKLRLRETGVVLRVGQQKGTGQKTALVQSPRGGKHLYWQDDLRLAEPT